METTDIRLLKAETLAQAVAWHQAHDGARYLAGGTDLMVNLRHGLLAPSALIDLSGLPELAGIVEDARHIRIGAGVTLARIAEHFARSLPVLAQAALAVAGPTHRESATLGGNLCLETRCIYFNQSAWWRAANGACLKTDGSVCHVAPTGQRCHAAFCGDLAPVLLVLGAEAEVMGPQGPRRTALAALYREDGQHPLRLEPGEVLCAVTIPRPIPAAAYEKVRVRGAIDFPLAGIAVALRRNAEVLTELRIGLTGTNSMPLLLDPLPLLAERPASARQVDEDFLQALSRLIQKRVQPMRTTVSAAHYRRRVASGLACRLTRRLWEEAAA